MTTRDRVRARWQQGILTPTDQIVIVVLILVQAIIRGSDYVRGVGLQGPEYALVVAAFGNAKIGWAFIGLGVGTIAAMLARWHLGVFLGLALLSLGYFAVGVPILLTIGIADAIRLPGIFLTPAVILGLTALRTGREPLRQGTSRTVEHVTAPGTDA